MNTERAEPDLESWPLIGEDTMQELILWDVRLEGGRPAGEEVKEVNEWVPLDYAIAWAVWKSGQYGGDVSLTIMAHGYEPRTGFLAGTRSTPGNTLPQRNEDGGVIPQPTATGLLGVYSQGGGGIQFCRDGILLGTIHQFEKLKGKVKLIEILGCGAAYITPGFEGRDGDGNLLCYRLAQITQAYVRASTATQWFDPTPVIDFGRWEGTVITYAPNGGLAKVQYAPPR